MAEGGVTVTGVGEAAATPDVLRVRMTVGCLAGDVSAAMAAAVRRSEAVTSALRSQPLGLADRDIRTAGFDVHRAERRAH
ncbi:MAG: SIMPL domain-containing protein, partial [Actinomycetota bacterium]|nr:SIMPL domain-containing protein [Actinomycetota bacterium]